MANRCPIVFQGHLVKFQGHLGQKKSLILTQIGCFQTVTPVLIHWWLWNDAHSLKQHMTGALLFFKICQISRSHWTKNRRFRTKCLQNVTIWCYFFFHSSILPANFPPKKFSGFFFHIQRCFDLVHLLGMAIYIHILIVMGNISVIAGTHLCLLTRVFVLPLEFLPVVEGALRLVFA